MRECARVLLTNKWHNNHMCLRASQLLERGAIGLVAVAEVSEAVQPLERGIDRLCEELQFYREIMMRK